MGTLRLGAFPSTGNKMYQDIIAKRLLEWYISRFSPGFFNHIFLNTQNNVASSYIVNTSTGELEKVQSGQKILTPALRLNVQQGRNNHDDVFGSLWNVNQQPGAFMVDTNMVGYKPFLIDPYGVILSSNDYTIRNNFDFIISLQTKADQLSFYNYCDTNLKHLYVQTIPVDTQIMIPNLLIEYIKKSVFKYEFDMLDKMAGDSEDKIKYRNKINELFTSYLYDFSNGCIKPFRESQLENGVTDYSYILNRKQLITLHLEKSDGDEGTKKGGLYTGFTVNMSGWMEYANPISFMTQVPAIIRGKKNDHFIRLSSGSDYKGNTYLMSFKEIFKDEREIVNIDKNVWKRMYTEYEIMMASSLEKFNILDDVIDVNDTPSCYYTMSALLDQISTKEEFNELFTVHIFKENKLISKNLYDIDEKFNITIRDCNLMVPYYIDIYVNVFKYEKYFDKIIDMLYKSGLYMDKNGLFAIGNIKNMSKSDLYTWLTQYYKHSKYQDYALINGKLLSGSKLFITVGDEYFWKYVHRRGWHYLTQQFENKTFIPIKIENFAKASSEYKYYVKNPNEEYIPVEEEVVEVRDDLEYYVKYDDEFFKIDREEVLVPDPEYEYYIFDRKTMKYAICVNLTKFDKKTQYYILRDQHINHDIIVKSST